MGVAGDDERSVMLTHTAGSALLKLYFWREMHKLSMLVGQLHAAACVQESTK